MQNKWEINYLVVPFSWLVGGITAIILGVLKQDWINYLIGLFTGLLNFGLMVKMNRRMVRLAKLDPEHVSLTVKKSTWFGAFLRFVVVAFVFAALYFKDVWQVEDNNAYIHLVIAFAGYLTVKVVLVATYLIFRKKVDP